MAKVLAVEDEALVRMLIVEALESSGYEVLEAGDGEAALAMVHDVPDIDVIVTDIRMPRMDGFSLALAARRLRPEVGLLFMTGYSEASVPGELASIRLLQKPFDPSEVVVAVKKIIERHLPG